MSGRNGGKFFTYMSDDAYRLATAIREKIGRGSKLREYPLTINKQTRPAEYLYTVDENEGWVIDFDEHDDKQIRKFLQPVLPGYDIQLISSGSSTRDFYKYKCSIDNHNEIGAAGKPIETSVIVHVVKFSKNLRCPGSHRLATSEAHVLATIRDQRQNCCILQTGGRNKVSGDLSNGYGKTMFPEFIGSYRFTNREFGYQFVVMSDNTKFLHRGSQPLDCTSLLFAAARLASAHVVHLELSDHENIYVTDFQNLDIIWEEVDWRYRDNRFYTLSLPIFVCVTDGFHTASTISVARRGTHFTDRLFFSPRIISGICSDVPHDCKVGNISDYVFNNKIYNSLSFDLSVRSLLLLQPWRNASYMSAVAVSQSRNTSIHIDEHVRWFERRNVMSIDNFPRYSCCFGLCPLPLDLIRLQSTAADESGDALRLRPFEEGYGFTTNDCTIVYNLVDNRVRYAKKKSGEEKESDRVNRLVLETMQDIVKQDWYRWRNFIADTAASCNQRRPTTPTTSSQLWNSIIVQTMYYGKIPLDQKPTSVELVDVCFSEGGPYIYTVSTDTGVHLLPLLSIHEHCGARGKNYGKDCGDAGPAKIQKSGHVQLFSDSRQITQMLVKQIDDYVTENKNMPNATRAFNAVTTLQNIIDIRIGYFLEYMGGNDWETWWPLPSLATLAMMMKFLTSGNSARTGYNLYDRDLPSTNATTLGLDPLPHYERILAFRNT